ncbi:MAG: UTP--glucose-1-phosphate uridylyltransferase GalU [Cardiobacteriaceae bacterium]|nr:UTP--glucose-1-phosphate uridylyltransferase GalU [Cardiobacteriaceae bacterium]
MFTDNEQEKIQIAVFPVAGFGTRFLPATKSTPKEMLPVVDKPLIQYAVEEAYDAGIRNMVFITGRSKWSITEHYDFAYELETELEKRGKKEFMTIVDRIRPRDMNVMFIRQERAMGLGHAVLCSEPIVRNRPFAVLLADDLIYNHYGIQVLKQMCAIYERNQQGVIGVQTVPYEHTHRYGIITAGSRLDDRTYRIEDIVEKPAVEEAPSDLAVIGRYILPGRIMQILANTQTGAGGEIQLTDAIKVLLKDKTILAYRFEGERYDCGDKLGYLQANVQMGIHNRDFGEDFKEYLRSLDL